MKNVKYVTMATLSRADGDTGRSLYGMYRLRVHGAGLKRNGLT